MKVTGLIFIFSFLAFKLIYGENSCMTTYRSNVYLIETNNSSISIKSFQPSTPSNNNNNNILWKIESETQQGVTSLFSCTTVHHYAFLLISSTISSNQQQPNDGENVQSIFTFDYDLHQWRHIPLDLDLLSTLITSSWNTEYIVYNTERRTAYYFDTQSWSWSTNDRQNAAQSPPLLINTTTNTPKMATVNSSLYYFFNDESDHHQNHIYRFDLMAKSWDGHFASFWSNDSTFYFTSDYVNNLYAIPRLKINNQDKFMRTINVNSHSDLVVQTPIIEMQSNDLVTNMGDDLVLYNGTLLMFYQPITNTISAIYGQDYRNPPDANSTTPATSFWSSSEGERIKIALGCSLSLGMILATVIGTILLRNRRRQHHQKDRGLLGDGHVATPNQHEAATGTSAPTIRTTKLSTSMQSLSFLNRDNAMVWSKHVHQLLALITFRRQQEEEQEEEEEKNEQDGDYPSMIKSSSTVSALAMSSVILSIISSSYSSAAANNNNAYLTPSTPMNRHSLDMTLPLPRNPLGQAESSSPPLK